MNVEKFLFNLNWLSDQVIKCITEEQLDTMKKFYRMVVSEQWCPDISKESIDVAIGHLNNVAEKHLNEKILVCQ